MLMSKAIIVFLFVFIAKTSSAFIKKSRRQVFNDYNHECGTYRAPCVEILNGKSDSKGLWPWKIALTYSSKHWLYPSKYFCGGVIISQTFVITAAHCLQPKQNDRTKDADIVLRFGAHELNVTREPGAISVPLLKSYIHEDWNPNSRRYDADIALLGVENPITFTNFINPICLWTGDIGLDSFDEKVGTLVGWGKTYDDEYSNVPREMIVPIVDNKKCWLDHNELLKLSSNRTFCGGASFSFGTPCDGSSGSGLYIRKNNKYYLRGLVSAVSVDEHGNCDATSYTIYTNIFMFTDWIKNTANIL